MRLPYLRPWINSWKLDCMFGGMEGVGADDAWYTTALDKEFCVLSGKPFIGGSVDLFKCFDQIVRPLLYAVLLLAGIPFQILIPYVNFIENILIYNSVAGSLGSPHTHHCGIPQGCPFSMLFITLYLRSWCIQMYSIGANPRTLADDLLVNSSGSRALHVFQAAFEATITHLLDLGGKLSAHKSKVYATLSTHRSWLTTYQWQGLQQLIPVVHCLRDL
eukprot:12417085-Karenia_brevis.AAC.1